MSQLERLRARLAQSRTLTLTHPLDESVTMVHRTPTPEEREQALSVARRGGAQEEIDASAGLLADTLIEVREDGDVIATTYGMDLYGALGKEWVQGETSAIDVVKAFYGAAEHYTLIVHHSTRVVRLSAGGPADPLD